MDKTDLPIGVFDSGIGGLTVLKALANVLPEESFLYLGDTARLPYGSKSPATIHKYCTQALHFLSQHGVKALVIACNSASSQFHDKSFAGVPVFNVIEPGAQMALQASQTGHIGILGTQATVSSGFYQSVLQQMAREQQRPLQIFAQTAPLFVPLAEEGWIHDPITNLIAHRYIAPLLQKQIDTLILGCTHYPILRDSVAKVCGPQITLIDSGIAVAATLQKQIQDGLIPARNPPADSTALTSQSPRTLQILSTDSSTQFASLAQHLLHPHAITAMTKVDL